MTKRGKVLRDTSAGTGLIVADNQQYSFTLEGVWKSEVLPAPGMAVDLELDAAGQITSIRAVTDSQISKEQTQAALEAAKSKGAEMASGIVARFGVPNLVAIALLLIGWFFLSAVSISSPLGNVNYTFWQVLGFLNAKNAVDLMMQAGGGKLSTGIYGFLAIIAIVAPFVRYFWKDKRAVLGGVLPLLFMLIVWLMARSSFNTALGVGTGATGVDPNNPFVQQMQDEIKKAISIGFGVYLSALAAIYFAGMSAKDFMASNAKTATPRA